MADNSALGQSTTKSLMRRGRAGDQWALNRLFERVVGPVRRWAHGRLPRNARRHTDTIDVVQEAALGVWRRLDRLDLSSPGDLEAYLRQAARNRIVDEVRRSAREPQAESVDPDQVGREPSPLDAALGHEGMIRYREALSRLSREDQECLIARFEMGYNYTEVAALLGRPSADAARMSVNRAFARLTDHLRE
jgi:RNA polymerase sigma-70 factor (ECF subfamily)